MNDFTKEELIEIRFSVGMSSFTPWLAEMYRAGSRELLDKIEVMIRNYCEHDCQFYLSPHGDVARCDKCNKGVPR